LIDLSKSEAFYSLIILLMLKCNYSCLSTRLASLFIQYMILFIFLVYVNIARVNQ